MQSTLYRAVYVGRVLPGLKPGQVVQACRIDFSIREPAYDGGTQTGVYSVWEARPHAATVSDDWTQVDRLDLVIPGHPVVRPFIDLGPDIEREILNDRIFDRV